MSGFVDVTQDLIIRSLEEIFMKEHIEDILRGLKTQTRRNSGRYEINKTYAIQPCRTCKGIPEGRILIRDKWLEDRTEYPTMISWDDAQDEGGYAPSNYEALYEKIHPKWTSRWAYEFEFLWNQSSSGSAKK